MFVLAFVLALPLLITLQQQPESEARVAELAVPLVEAEVGNFEPLGRHIRVTLNMFHSDGDDEWLYNIPHRPVFGWLGALFFWGGVLIALVLGSQSLYLHLLRLFKRRSNSTAVSRQSTGRGSRQQAALFLLLWWLAGIAPGFISVPPASLGHTILAQPVTFLLMALPFWWWGQIGRRQGWSQTQGAVALFGVVLVMTVAGRDWPAYFGEWPQRGMVRFLYRADIGDVADYLQEHPETTDFGITGLLAGPWDKLALQAELGINTAVSARWYNPERVLLLQPALSFAGFPEITTPYVDAYTDVPDVKGIGGYRLQSVNFLLPTGETVCFQNGLCALTAVYEPDLSQLTVAWRVERVLDLPPEQIISNPPPPGVYAGPRLLVFGQLWDAEGNFLTGDDGLWIDPYTLQVGDVFVQQHRWQVSAEGMGETAVFGLYDPLTGQRILTEAGQELVEVE